MVACWGTGGRTLVFPFRPLRSSPPSEVCGLCPCPATLPELVLAGEAVHAGKDRGVVFHAETGAGLWGGFPSGLRNGGCAAVGEWMHSDAVPLRQTPRSQPRRPAWGRHGRGSKPLLCRFLSHPQLRLLAISSLSLVCLLASCCIVAGCRLGVMPGAATSAVGRVTEPGGARAAAHPCH